MEEKAYEAPEAQEKENEATLEVEGLSVCQLRGCMRSPVFEAGSVAPGLGEQAVLLQKSDSGGAREASLKTWPNGNWYQKCSFCEVVLMRTLSLSWELSQTCKPYSIEAEFLVAELHRFHGYFTKIFPKSLILTRKFIRD